MSSHPNADRIGLPIHTQTQKQTHGYVGTTPTPLTRGRSFRRLSPEMRALASEAYALWRDLARERANPYGDHAGCLLAGRMAVDATRWEDGLVVLAAIRQRMDSKSSPRWIAEWARDVGATMREDARKHTRITEAAPPDDPEVLRVMLDVARSRARGEAAPLPLCVVCGGMTEGRCERCAAPLHASACPTRHGCAA